MKHIKIILALTITVLGFSLLVFGANEATFQAILDIKTEKANAAKFLVLPELNATDDAAAINMFYAPECPNDLPDGVTCNDTEYDLSGTTIEKLFVIPGKGYIYESKFVGYNAADPIIYMIGVNEAGVITGFHIVYQNDSAGIGAEIANPLFAKQFVGQTLDFAGNGEYVDAVTGSTFPVTLGGMKAGVTSLINFHKATFQGVKIETPEEKLARWYEEISVVGAVFTDVTTNYTLPTNIVKMEVANDGTNDVAVIYTVVFDGYSSTPSKYMVSFDKTTGDLIGLRVLEANDTAGYGAEIVHPDFIAQFDNMTQEDAKAGTIVDGFGGATYGVTLSAIRASLKSVVETYSAEFEGVVVETPEEKLARWYQEITAIGAVFTDVSSSYTLPEGVLKMEKATLNGFDWAMVYTVEFDGYASTASQYMVSVSLIDGSVLGLRVLVASDTPGYGAEIVHPDFLAQFDGMAQAMAENGLFVDGFGGATYDVTLGAMKASVISVIQAYRVEFEGVLYETEAERLVRLHEEITAVGTTFTDVSGDYTLPAGILKMEMANNGTADFAVVYTVEFAGYSSTKSVYLVSVSTDDGHIIGLRVITASDTPGWGAEIVNDGFTAQFTGMTQAEAEAGSFVDGFGGATYTVTLGAIKASIVEVVTAYKAEFEGVVPETDAERLERYYDEITSDTATFTDVSSSYTLIAGVTKMEMANNGSEDFAIVYTVKTEGYDNTETGDITYLVSIDLTTGNIIGVRVVESLDTVGIGSKIAEEAFFPQFDNITQTVAQAGDFDAQAGASFPITLSDFESSLSDVVDFYKAEFEGVAIETPEEKLARYYDEITSDTATFTDVTGNYTVPSAVTKVEMAKEAGTDFAVVYTVVFQGYTTNDTKYLISIDLDTNLVLGVRVFEAGDSGGIGSLIGEEEFFTQFANMTLANAEAGNYDEQAGASYPLTLNDFATSLDTVINLYNITLGAPERPDPIPMTVGQLQAAFSNDVVSGNSIYGTNPFEDGIDNIYAVYDNNSILLGYVYQGYYEGREPTVQSLNNNIYFSLGIGLDGVTKNFTILIEYESWENAPTYTDPEKTTWGTDFTTTTWHDQFENTSILGLLSSPVDGIAGVTISTGGLLNTVETIIYYHINEIVGGSN